MDDYRLAKQVFSKAPNGTKRGLQRTRWVDQVDKDGRDLGIRDLGEERQLTPERRGPGKSIQRRLPSLVAVYNGYSL
uniref:Uncharacterized protein n=1 Tax=Megaselia scalaris TaxID=36166 RepID=T1GCS9_MEGSC